MAKREDITAGLVRTMLDYDPETGVMIWKARATDMFEDGKHSAVHNCAKWNAKFAGKVAGTLTGGYWIITIFHHHFRRGRLAWAWMMGAFPKEEVDHEDVCPLNDKFKNLREATSTQNKGNQRIPRHNSSGAKGISWDKKNNKWEANIHIANKKKHLGRFYDFNDAVSAYNNAAEKHFGEFSRAS